MGDVTIPDETVLRTYGLERHILVLFAGSLVLVLKKVFAAHVVGRLRRVADVTASSSVFKVGIRDAETLARFIERSSNVDFRFGRIKMRMLPVGFSPRLGHRVHLTVRTVRVVGPYD